MSTSQKKAEIIQLSFKKSTQGLTPAEEARLENLKREVALEQSKESK